MTKKISKRKVTTTTVEWVEKLADDDGNAFGHFQAKYGNGAENGDFYYDFTDNVSEDDYMDDYESFKEEFLAAVADIEVRKVEKDED